ncbi:MAG: superoxide dismutase [Alphaproteobacteria bacterium]|jgi:Fe-Mn family superoxide dismutase|nr:superoxide dismutase [Alphaproteobacteria bacterium]
MPHTLPDLPYDISALEPHISAQTLTFHHGKHHQAYVTNLNNLTQNTELADKSLEEIIHATAKNPEKIGIFNNAAQVWNHTFFWNCMKPQGGGQPMGDLKAMIEKGFGSYEAFAAEFKQAALTQFGSGWAWLVLEKGNLRIMKTANADLPMVHGATALLTCDVWEHAYYLDYQNRRPDYVDTFLAHLVNWDFAASLLNAA